MAAAHPRNRRAARTALMLELFMIIRDPRKRYTFREIASVVGCSWQYIYYTEKRALHKLAAAAKDRGFY